MSRPKFQTIDDYIASFPKETQVVLEKIRQTIKSTVPPEAEEAISYAIPTFKLHGKFIVYFAGYKSHVSLYPIPQGDDSFQKEIAPFVAGKGTLRFSLDKPIPYELIKQVANISLKQNEERYKKNK